MYELAQKRWKSKAQINSTSEDVLRLTSRQKQVRGVKLSESLTSRKTTRKTQDQNKVFTQVSSSCESSKVTQYECSEILRKLISRAIFGQPLNAYVLERQLGLQAAARGVQAQQLQPTSSRLGGITRVYVFIKGAHQQPEHSTQTYQWRTNNTRATLNV